MRGCGRYSATVHTAPCLPFCIAALPVLSATLVVSRLSWSELDGGKQQEGPAPEDLAMLQHALQEFGKDDERYLQKRRAVEEKSRGAVGDDGLDKPLLDS